MLLTDYLNEHFFDDTVPVEKLNAHFLEKFGVNVYEEGGVFAFKYNQFDAKWEHPITHECRGVLLRQYLAQWYVESRPFDKFFNYGEPQNKHTWERIKRNPEKYDLREKLDGTLIQMWFDTVLSNWRLSTLRAPTTGIVPGYKIGFDQLFCLNIDPYNFQNTLPFVSRTLTLLFELCTSKNRVVTDYGKDKIVLLAARDENKEHEYLGYDAIMKLADSLNVSYPYREPIKAGLSKEAFLNSAEALNKYEGNFGKNPEGFVIYYKNAPVAKLKNQAYCKIHKIVSGSPEALLNMVMESFFAGTIDDIHGHLPPLGKRYLASIRGWFANEQVLCAQAVAEINENMAQLKTQKKYADFLNDRDYRHKPFLFWRRHEILSSDYDPRLFEAWFTGTESSQKPWKRYKSEIKKACLSECMGAEECQ